MINIKDVITEYLNSSYSFIRWIDDSENVSLIKSLIDNKEYVCKYRTHYDIDVYRRLKSLNIQGVPQIYELIESEGYLIIVEEYINGVNLSEYINNNIELCKSEEWISTIGIRICNILNSLHEQSTPIIHRDIKPDNIIIDSDDIYIVDFNIAREYTGNNDKDTFIMGTKDYAAPEQFGFKESDVRTDIYGLGATLKYMVDKTGCNSSKLSRIITKAMDYIPDKRYSSAKEMSKALNSGNGYTLNGLRKYALPGYRRGNIFFIILSTAVYAYVAYTVIFFKMGGNVLGGNMGKLYDLMGALYILITFLSVVFFTFNYMDIRKRFFEQIHVWDKNKVLKVFLTFIIDILIVLLYLLVYIVLACIIFGADTIASM